MSFKVSFILITASVLMSSLVTSNALISPSPVSSIPRSQRTYNSNSSLYDSSTHPETEIEDEYSNDAITKVYRSNMTFGKLIHRAGGKMSDVRKRQDLLMSMALFASYFTVMFGKCALPSTFALITSKDSGLVLQNANAIPQQILAQILTVSTIAIAVGKILLGPVIDKYGGVLSLKVALTSLLGSLLVISSTSSFRIFSIALICVDFIFSSCWAACLNAIHQSFSLEHWSSSIGLLAVAARIGNAAAFFFFSSLLQWSQQLPGDFVGQSWRNVFRAASLIQIIPIVLLMFAYKGVDDTIVRNNLIEEENLPLSDAKSVSFPRRPSIRESIRTLRKESHTVAFWMHLLSRSCLMIVASFLTFVPSYMTNAFGLSNAAAAKVGSLYAIGCLISVSIGAKMFSTLNMRGKITSTICYLGTFILSSSLQLLHISGIMNISTLVGIVSFFLWGIGFAVPFYIPPSLFALKRGGKESSATSK